MRTQIKKSHLFSFTIKNLMLLSTLVLLICLFTNVSVYAEGESTWTIKAPMLNDRSHFQTVAINGKIYAIGGRINWKTTNTVEEYDPTLNIWKSKSPMSYARSSSYESAVINGKIYVFGGKNDSTTLNSVEEYNPVTDTWVNKASMYYERCLQQVVVLNDKIYVLGGYNGSNALKTAEEYDPATNRWKLLAPMSTERMNFQAVVLNGRIYAIGGSKDGNSLNSIEEYNPDTDTWETKSPMLARRESFEAVVLNNEIYAIGSEPTTIPEKFNPETNEWTSLNPMSIRRVSPEATVLDSKIYVTGGSGGSGFINSVDVYNPTTGEWKTTSPMSFVRYIHQLEILNGSIYVIGGDRAHATVEEYTSEANFPTTLIATATSSEVSLSWDVVDGATGYNIKRSTTSGYGYSTITTNSAITTLTDTSVTNGTKYYYLVTAVNASGDISNSNEVSATPKPSIPSAPKGLTINSSYVLFWNSVKDATSYTIRRGTASGTYDKTVSGLTGAMYVDKDIDATKGNTYYYVVTAVNASGESAYSNEVSIAPTDYDLKFEVTSVDKAKVGDTITTDIVLRNANNICAEDIEISFDTSKLQFISVESADGIKIYNKTSISDSIKRYITASLGKANAANGDKVLLTLTFKTISAGEAKIDITNGRIADNATLEMDVAEENCGEKTVMIEYGDVNRSGEFTLLDLGIDAWYYGDAVADTDTSIYETDIVPNGIVDDADLSKIVEKILNNRNYPASAQA